MIKEYFSSSAIILVILLGSSKAPHVHSEPGAVKEVYAENAREVATITSDVGVLSEPREIHRYEPSQLQLLPNTDLTGVHVEFKSIDGPASSMYPRFRVTNTGVTDLNLAGLALHYWFNCDCAAATTEFEGVVDWAGFMPSGLSITSRLRVSFERASSGRQTHAMIVRFVSDSPTLAPEQSVEIHTRFNRKDWGNMPPMNDWSYAPFDTFTGWNKVAGYINGSRVWGQEP